MLLGVESDAVGWVVGVGGVLTAIGTAVISGVVSFMNARHKNEMEKDAGALAQYREIADRQQKQIERQDTHIGELSQAIEQLSDDHSNCQVELAELYGHLQLSHEFGRRAAACLKRLGEDPGELPRMPDRPARPDRAEMEFRKRTLQQNTNLVLPGGHPPQPPGGSP